MQHFSTIKNIRLQTFVFKTIENFIAFW